MKFGDWVKLVLLVFALVVALRFLGDVARILLLFALVIIFSMMLTPPVSWLERRRVSRALGAPLVVLVLLGIFTLIAFWIIPPLIEQFSLFISSLPTYWNRATDWLSAVTERYPRAQEIVTVNETLINQALARAETILVQAGQFTLGLISGIAAAVLIFVMTVFTLVRPRSLLVGLMGMIPERSRLPVSRALLVTAQQMRVYAWSSILVGLVNGTVAWLGLSFLGVEPALLLAALVFFGEFFPYVGPIAAAIPAIILALLVSPLTALWTLLLYLGIQQLEASVLSPLIVSRQMKFHPLSVAFAILTLGELFGVLGAFLAIPALAAIKAFYNELILKPRQLDAEQLEGYANTVVEAKRLHGEEES